MEQVRVLIADDQALTRQGLRALLAAWPEIEVVGMAANGTEIVQLMEQCEPDVALIDILIPASASPGAPSSSRGGRALSDSLPASRGHPRESVSPSPERYFDSTFGRQGGREGTAEETDGLAAIRSIKSRWPQVRVVVLTMYTTHRVAALAAGADAFLLKGCPSEELQYAILKTG